MPPALESPHLGLHQVGTGIWRLQNYWLAVSYLFLWFKSVKRLYSRGQPWRIQGSGVEDIRVIVGAITII